jgi:hypothetical protein
MTALELAEIIGNRAWPEHMGLDTHYPSSTYYFNNQSHEQSLHVDVRVDGTDVLLNGYGATRATPQGSRRNGAICYTGIPKVTARKTKRWAGLQGGAPAPDDQG